MLGVLNKEHGQERRRHLARAAGKGVISEKLK